MEENFEKQEQGAQENASAADFVSSYGGQNPVPPMEEKPINMITGKIGRASCRERVFRAV